MKLNEIFVRIFNNFSVLSMNLFPFLKIKSKIKGHTVEKGDREWLSDCLLYG
ncbi:hypothetical protein QY97_00716 [Bacillus thermotolerans]|uniref:Uncharacterized protein n=1 Tax=Bacillus thermotolerans TaxID=1221996 RepID=A0A0F5I560_BACTR|nr:hypothetical protein QY97_00716 [Bacillus thermotolerans]KKB40799.1 hypothetical protein QY95_01373 [Bacillus thermotolerans]